MKQPAIQFYTGDWFKDTELSLCDAATRGIWIDFILRMHDRDRCGRLEGTRKGLAQLGRCTEAQLDLALAELSATKTATVTEHHGIVTVTNRRMRRDYEERQEAAKRAKNYRKRHRQDGDTDESQENNEPRHGESNAEITSLSSSSSSSSDEIKERGREENPEPQVSAKAEFWDALCDIFGTRPTSHREELRLFDQCGEFRAKGATVDEVRRRAAAYREKWPDMPCTPNALLSNWDLFKPKEKAPRKPYYTAESAGARP